MLSRGLRGSSRREPAESSSAEEENAAKKKSRANSGSGAGERFQSMIDEGFFDKPRTLSDLQKQYHKEAIIVPQTSLPSYLLKGVRSKQLDREKADVSGKTVWTYTTRNKK